jgi:hypothetical protein
VPSSPAERNPSTKWARASNGSTGPSRPKVSQPATRCKPLRTCSVWRAANRRPSPTDIEHSSDGFKAAGIKIWQSDYDELAILSFLDHPARVVVERVVSLTFNLASSIAFCDLVKLDSGMREITDAKALLDTQAIIAAQQATSAAAASSAAVAASTTSS